MLILGSGSPARKALMVQVGLVPDKVIVPNIDEKQNPKEGPRDYVLRVAKEKAIGITISKDDHLVTADTIVSLGNQILNKTDNLNEAKKYLKQISGRRHKVFSAVCIKHNGSLFFGIEKTIVKARLLSVKEIDSYLSFDEWRNKAGGYAIQGYAMKFFPFISGCYSNIIGLPLNMLYKKLHASGFRLKN